jgi:hypothetical protein
MVDNFHKQSKVYFEVDEKISPLIKYLMDKYPSVVPFNSCQGGMKKEEGNEKWYIMFLVRDLNQFNNMCGELEIKYAEYQIPTNEFANCPSYIIRGYNLDGLLERLGINVDK